MSTQSLKLILDLPRSIIMLVFHLLFGREPTRQQTILTLLIGIVCALAVFYVSGGNYWLGFSAFDICGGVVTNSFSSTRKFWAGLPILVVPVFVIAHLLELPRLWQAGSDMGVIWFLSFAMATKLFVFIFGQQKYR